MYDLTAPRIVTVPVSEMCNLFIHSFIFRFAWTLQSVPWEEYWLLPESDPRCEAVPTELAGFLIATDKSMAQHLSFVSVEELVRVSKIFATDEAVAVNFQRDYHGRMHANAFGREERPDRVD